MEDSNFLDPAFAEKNHTAPETLEPNNEKIKEPLILAPKKINKLETDLIKTLLDPLDSDYRKRYIRRWIYGEELRKSSIRKSRKKN
tara:strand:- start:471 stop:728 length:258 start_codon:yes stop_codon:yes gene_type:complete